MSDEKAAASALFHPFLLSTFFTKILSIPSQTLSSLSSFHRVLHHLHQSENFFFHSASLVDSISLSLFILSPPHLIFLLERSERRFKNELRVRREERTVRTRTDTAILLLLLLRASSNNYPLLQYFPKTR